MFLRESASDLLWGMSHRKAIAHAVPQVRLARHLEAAIPPAPALGQSLSPDRLVPPRPDLRGPGIAPQFPTDRRRRPVQPTCTFLFTPTTRIQPTDLTP